MSDRPDQYTTPDENKQETPSFVKYIIIGLGALAGLIAVSLVVALIAGLTGSEGVGSVIRGVRDFFIIILALQGILISVAMVVLILQLTALINLLRNEVKPIIDEARTTAATVRGTTEFMSQNVASPVIKAAATVAGAKAFMGDLMGIRRNVNGRVVVQQADGKRD